MNGCSKTCFSFSLNSLFPLILSPHHQAGFSPSFIRLPPPASNWLPLTPCSPLAQQLLLPKIILKKFVISYTISFYTHRTPIRINYILLIRKSLIQQSKSSSIFCVPVAVVGIRNHSCKSILQWESRPGPPVTVALLTGCVMQGNYLPQLTFHF